MAHDPHLAVGLVLVERLGRRLDDSPDQCWLEHARRAFLTRYYAENGDLIDDATQTYGE